MHILQQQTQQVVKVDPWDELGSLTHTLGDAGPVMALACHPSRPLVTACLSDGTVGLWDYQAVGEGGGGGSDGGMMGGGDGYLGATGGVGSPPASPPRGRGSGKSSRDEK